MEEIENEDRWEKKRKNRERKRTNCRRSRRHRSRNHRSHRRGRVRGWGERERPIDKKDENIKKSPNPAFRSKKIGGRFDFLTLTVITVVMAAIAAAMVRHSNRNLLRWKMRRISSSVVFDLHSIAIVSLSRVIDYYG